MYACKYCGADLHFDIELEQLYMMTKEHSTL